MSNYGFKGSSIDYRPCFMKRMLLIRIYIPLSLCKNVNIYIMSCRLKILNEVIIYLL